MIRSLSPEKLTSLRRVARLLGPAISACVICWHACASILGLRPALPLLTSAVFYGLWTIIDYDEVAAAQTLALRKARVRIGTMDLKIASIALTRDVLLLTANARDFAQVPGLRFENWLH